MAGSAGKSKKGGDTVVSKTVSDFADCSKFIEGSLAYFSADTNGVLFLEYLV